jgi:hypothetical protein
VRLVIPFIASAVFFLLAGVIATPSNPDGGFDLIVIAAGMAGFAVIGTALVVLGRCRSSNQERFESVEP